MTTRTLFALTVVSAGLFAAGSAYGDEPAAGAQVAVHKALTFLASDMRVWRQERRCAACHHGPMYVWAANVARRQGYVVDDFDVAETTKWLVSSDEARIFPKMAASGGTKPRLSQATIYLAHALNTLPADDLARKVGWKRIAEHLAAAQSDDGSWSGPAGRPPIFGSPGIVTRLAEIAVAESEAISPAREAVRSRARAWVARSRSEESHQSMALQLWSESVGQSGDGGTVVKRLTDL